MRSGDVMSGMRVTRMVCGAKRRTPRQRRGVVADREARTRGVRSALAYFSVQ